MKHMANSFRPDGVEPGETEDENFSFPLGNISLRMTKLQAEEMLKSLVGGDIPFDGDSIEFTLSGWVFKPGGVGVGNARQLLQTNAAGDGVEWTSFVDLPGIFVAQVFREDFVVSLDNSGVPDVSNHQNWRTGGTTNITDFDNGLPGHRLSILAQHSVTIVHNASIIVLAGSVNFNMVSGDTLILQMFNNQIWHEISRSIP